MQIVGLTGGIAMGKSTVAALFRRARIPVFDADRAVHTLQGPGGKAVAPIGRLRPDAVRNGAVDRARLRQAIADDPSLLPALERIIHPLVRREQARFLARARARGASLAVLDVPLLFEGGGDLACDLVATVSASRAAQRHRIRLRRAMTPAQAEQLIGRQMTDHERRARADVVIRTGLSRHHATIQVRRLLSRLGQEPRGAAPGPRRGRLPRTRATLRTAG